MSHCSGPYRLGAVDCAHVHLVVSALWRFGGECICRFQLVGFEVNVYRFRGECISKWSVVENMLGDMVVRVRW